MAVIVFLRIKRPVNPVRSLKREAASMMTRESRACFSVWRRGLPTGGLGRWSPGALRAGATMWATSRRSWVGRPSAWRDPDLRMLCGVEPYGMTLASICTWSKKSGSLDSTSLLLLSEKIIVFALGTDIDLNSSSLHVSCGTDLLLLHLTSCVSSVRRHFCDCRICSQSGCLAVSPFRRLLAVGASLTTNTPASSREDQESLVKNSCIRNRKWIVHVFFSIQ